MNPNPTTILPSQPGAITAFGVPNPTPTTAPTPVTPPSTLTVSPATSNATPGASTTIKNLPIVSPTNLAGQQITGNTTTPSGAVVNASTGALVTPPKNSTVNSSIIGNTNPIPVIGTPTPNDTHSSFVNNVTTSISPNAFTPPADNPSLTAANSANIELQNRLKQLQTQEQGKGAATQQVYSDAGLFTQQKQKADLYGQIQMKTAAFTAAENRAQYAGDTTDYGLGAAAMVRREAAVEIGALSAAYAAADQQYTTAKSIADQTISFQFAPIEQAIADTQTNIENNKINMSAAQTKQAQIVQGSLALQQAQIDQAKVDRQHVFDIMSTAAQNGADPQTLANISKSSNPKDAISTAGGYLSYPFLLKLYQDGITSTPPTIGGNNQPSTGGQTPAVVNNNPGNLKDPLTGKFQTFPSMQAGYLALQQDLYGKVTGATSTSLNGNSTLLDFANVYAPSSDNNNPSQYAKNLASTLGVPVSTKIGTFKDNIASFANAVSKNEDINANNLINGIKAPTPQQTTTPDMKPTQTGEDFYSLKQIAPPFVSAGLQQLQSNGSAYIDLSKIPANGNAQASNFAKTHNIPLLTASEADNAKNTDEAIRNIVNVIAPAWKEIAPGGVVQRGINTTNYMFSKAFDTNFYTQNNTFNQNKEALAAQISALSKSAPRLGLLSTAENALPDNTGLSGFGGTYDTLKDGNSKLQRTLDLLNQSLKTYIPGSKEVKLNDNLNSLSVVAPDGNSYTFPDQQSLDNFKKAANIQ